MWSQTLRKPVKVAAVSVCLQVFDVGCGLQRFPCLVYSLATLLMFSALFCSPVHRSFFLCFSALCLVVGKKGPDNSALVSTSLLSSAPSLVAFGELRSFSLETRDAQGSTCTSFTYYLTVLMLTRVRRKTDFHLKFILWAFQLCSSTIKDNRTKSSITSDSPIQYFIVMSNTDLCKQSVNPSFI